MPDPNAKRVAVVHGPNLNLLGQREPEVYGRATLEEIDERLRASGRELGLEVTCFQSNHEGVLIDHLHEIRTTHQAVIINPGGFTHTSVALRDALAALEMPLYEVHLSNIHARESFRHHSFISPLATAVLCGLGPEGYEAALRAAAGKIAEK